MNAVSIDVSKGESMIAVMRPGKKDAQKIANYAIDNWNELSQHFPEEDVRLMPKDCYRQYAYFSKIRAMMKLDLISLLDVTFPDANHCLTAPDERMKVKSGWTLQKPSGAVSASVDSPQQMQTLAKKIPQYPVVMQMLGIGPVLGPQITAEIGDVRRFHSKKA